MVKKGPWGHKGGVILINRLANFGRIGFERRYPENLFNYDVSYNDSLIDSDLLYTPKLEYTIPIRWMLV